MTCVLNTEFLLSWDIHFIIISLLLHSQVQQPGDQVFLPNYWGHRLSTTALQRVLRLYWTVSLRLYCFIIYMCSVKYEVSATLFDICLSTFDYLCKQHVLTFCYNHLSFDFVNRANIASSRKLSRRYQEGVIMNSTVDQDNRSGWTTSDPNTLDVRGELVD